MGLGFRVLKIWKVQQFQLDYWSTASILDLRFKSKRQFTRKQPTANCHGSQVAGATSATFDPTWSDIIQYQSLKGKSSRSWMMLTYCKLKLINRLWSYWSYWRLQTRCDEIVDVPHALLLILNIWQSNVNPPIWHYTYRILLNCIGYYRYWILLNIIEWYWAIPTLEFDGIWEMGNAWQKSRQ